jgi:hypothetical protein
MSTWLAVRRTSGLGERVFLPNHGVLCSVRLSPSFRFSVRKSPSSTRNGRRSGQGLPVLRLQCSARFHKSPASFLPSYLRTPIVRHASFHSSFSVSLSLSYRIRSFSCRNSSYKSRPVPAAFPRHGVGSHQCKAGLEFIDHGDLNHDDGAEAPQHNFSSNASSFDILGACKLGPPRARTFVLASISR